MVKKSTKRFKMPKSGKVYGRSKGFISKNWWLVPVAILVVSAALAVVVLNRPKKTIPQPIYSSQTDSCASVDKASFECYKTQLSAIVNAEGPKKAIALLKGSYESVGLVKSQCHQMVHVVGRTALKKYTELADTFQRGDHFCWAGYYHGAMEQLSIEKGYDYILNHTDEICSKIAAKERYSFYHYNCVHGMGHGFMMVQDNELFKVLASCDKMSDDWERQSCWGGAFMQNVMEAQTSADHTSKYLKRDQPMYPCTAVAEKYKYQCYLMQTSYALEVSGYDFSKIFALCGGLTGTDAAYRVTCYQSAGRDASGQSASNVEQTVSTCLLDKSSEARTNCVIGAVKDFISYFYSDQQAQKLCDALPLELQPICKSTAKDYYATF